MITDYDRRDLHNDNTDLNDALKGLRTATTSSPSFGSYAYPTNLNTGISVEGVEGAMSGIEKIVSNLVADLSESSMSASLSNSDHKPPEEGDISGGLIAELIQILIAVVKLPTKFGNIYHALIDSGETLGKSMSGIGKSAYLGIKDIIILVVAIVKVILKYAKCILSFIITTTFGCLIIHILTFLCYILYLIFPISAYLIWTFSNIDMNPTIDSFFEMIDQADNQFEEMVGFYLTKWPHYIHMFCYTCFFQEVKLKEVLDDVMVVKDIGDMIQNDFNNKIPVYFRPAKKPALSAKRNFDALMS
jgi:hypothetical protein